MNGLKRGVHWPYIVKEDGGQPLSCPMARCVTWLAFIEKKGVGFVGKETGELAVIDTPFSEGRYGFLRDGLTTF